MTLTLEAQWYWTVVFGSASIVDVVELHQLAGKRRAQISAYLHKYEADNVSWPEGYAKLTFALESKREQVLNALCAASELHGVGHEQRHRQQLAAAVDPTKFTETP